MVEWLGSCIISHFMVTNRQVAHDQGQIGLHLPRNGGPAQIHLPIDFQDAAVGPSVTESLLVKMRRFW